MLQITSRNACSATCLLWGRVQSWSWVVRSRGEAPELVAVQLLQA